MGVRGDAIAQFDWTVGQIIAALDERGLRENTLIILSSDNGPVVDDGYDDHAEELLNGHSPAAVSYTHLKALAIVEVARPHSVPSRVGGKFCAARSS